CFQISDNGYGITIHQRYKIFTNLFRVDNIRRYDTEGNGLGLYIVKSVLEKFGSEIWFESKENEGTTFFVSIPLDRVRVP
ncbi:MAG: ATP-binding protein, partial [Patescibacteria group bacterium]